MQDTIETATVLDRFLSSLRLGEPTVHHCLCVVPVLAEGPASPDYLAFVQAVESGQIEITEVNEGGHVPELRVENRMDCEVLLMEGEELVGAKQNRVVNTSILVGRHKSVVIPVSCVERGRWGYRRRGFAPSTQHLYASLRGRKTRSVTTSLRQGRNFRSDQGEVWADIASKSERMRTTSQTEAMAGIFDACAADIASYEKAFAPQPGQVGLTGVVGGRVIGFDVFSSPDVLSSVYPRIVRSYVLDAIDVASARAELAPEPEDGKPVDEARLARAATERFVARFGEGARESYDSMGEGVDVRIEDAVLAGFALLHGDHVVHAAAFAT